MPELYPTSIYGLVDPRDNELRYVGKTILSLNDRLTIHRTDARKGLKRHVCNWIRSLWREGLEPEIFEIESVEENWVEQEQFWIAYFKSLGARLTNHTIGGEGALGYRHTEESRRKMSVLSKAYFSNEEARKKTSEAARAQHADPEKRARWEVAHAKIVVSQEVRDRKAQWNRDNGQRIREIFRNDPVKRQRRADAIRAALADPEVRKRKSESTRRRHAEHPFSAETRAKLSRAFKGRVFSDETRAKMSIAAKNRRKKAT